MNLCIDKRGVIKNQVYLTSDRVELTFEMPLSEIVFDFYDKLKVFQRDMLPLIIIIQITRKPIWSGSIFFLTEKWWMPFQHLYTGACI
jgi:hypothetical protein